MEKITAGALFKYWVKQLTISQIFTISWYFIISSYAVVLLAGAILKGDIAQTAILVFALMCFLKALHIYTKKLVVAFEKDGEHNEVNN